jgi:hypothetical protein
VLLKCACQFAGNRARFANPAQHHAPCACQQHLHRLLEARIERLGDALDGVHFDL